MFYFKVHFLFLELLVYLSRRANIFAQTIKRGFPTSQMLCILEFGIDFFLENVENNSIENLTQAGFIRRLTHTDLAWKKKDNG